LTLNDSVSSSASPVNNRSNQAMQLTAPRSVPPAKRSYNLQPAAMRAPGGGS